MRDETMEEMDEKKGGGEGRRKGGGEGRIKKRFRSVTWTTPFKKGRDILLTTIVHINTNQAADTKVNPVDASVDTALLLTSGITEYITDPVN